MPGIAISGIVVLGNRSMRNVITVAGIVLALTAVTPSLQAAESQGTLPSIRPNARSRIRISAQGFLSATVSLYGCLRTFYE